MKVTLKSTNSEFSHDILLVPEGDKVSIVTQNGNKIAQLSIASMQDDNKTMNSGRFFLVFDISEKSPIDKNIAIVFNP